MSKKLLNLTVALKDNAITKIDEVASGLKCGCYCPACGEPLIARKGQQRVHHFAHSTGHNCEYGYETSLHLAAKDILLRAKRMVIPAVYVNFPDSYKKDELVHPAKEIEIERVELECRFGDVVPDVVVYHDGKPFFVEIFVTHCIDDKKLNKLQKADISTIEIDLSKKTDTLSVLELEELLLADCKEKKWKYHSDSSYYLKAFYQASDVREIVTRGFAMHIDDCPIRSRIYRGKSYANFIDDCLYCKYCISSFGDNILCSGRHRIATIKDFRVPEEQRKNASDAEITQQMYSSFAAGKCPYCGGRLLERKGKYGTFWGCDRFPHCRFTASIDPNTGELIIKK